MQDLISVLSICFGWVILFFILTDPWVIEVIEHSNIFKTPYNLHQIPNNTPRKS